MSSNKIAEGVGKKIVEALKQQSDVEIVPVQETPDEQDSQISTESISMPEEKDDSIFTASFEGMKSGILDSVAEPSGISVDNSLNNSLMNFKVSDYGNRNTVEEMELPSNVAILRQLITKIPTGVSKQTGALIIKQTMEALGISMTNVLQEAQQVQERLTQSVKECQMNVLDYKKQINILEVQAQKYQRQFAAINDIISLFIQTN